MKLRESLPTIKNLLESGSTYVHIGGRNGDAEMVWFAETLGFEYEDPYARSSARRAVWFLDDLGYRIVDESGNDIRPLYPKP